MLMLTVRDLCMLHAVLAMLHQLLIAPHRSSSSTIALLYLTHMKLGLLPIHWVVGAVLHAAAAVAFSRLFFAPQNSRQGVLQSDVVSATIATSTATGASASSAISGTARLRGLSRSLAPVVEGDETEAIAEKVKTL
jgi:hypothetical protein